MHQEAIYKSKEANAFFERNKSEILLQENGLRESKQIIYKTIKEQIPDNVEEFKVLEVGCFIGDLLNKLHTEHKCQITGIEPSSLACEYAKNKFGLDIINETFNNSIYFGLTKQTRHQFDLIIADDVLSWMSREVILPCMASLDWLLKPGGYIYTRDFNPSYDFAYMNHHQPGEDIYNFKVNGGHKKFLLATGKYVIISEYIRNDSSHQKVSTKREDSMIWSDCMLMKVENTMQPKLSM